MCACVTYPPPRRCYYDRWRMCGSSTRRLAALMSAGWSSALGKSRLPPPSNEVAAYETPPLSEARWVVEGAVAALWDMCNESLLGICMCHRPGSRLILSSGLNAVSSEGPHAVLTVCFISWHLTQTNWLHEVRAFQRGFSLSHIQFVILNANNSTVA